MESTGGGHILIEDRKKKEPSVGRKGAIFIFVPLYCGMDAGFQAACKMSSPIATVIVSMVRNLALLIDSSEYRVFELRKG